MDDGTGESLRAPLAQIAEQLRVLLEGPLDARTRHAIGAIVAEVKRAPDRYGVGAVAQLAAAVGEDVTTLYRHALVAECWTASEVVGLLEAPGRLRVPWSHLVQIAALDSPVERELWLERVRVEGLSLRKLGTLLASRSAGLEEPRTRLERAALAAERFLDEASTLGDSLATEGAPPQLVERAIAAHRRLKELAESRLQGLSEASATSAAGPVRTRSGTFARLIAGAEAERRHFQR